MEKSSKPQDKKFSIISNGIHFLKYHNGVPLALGVIFLATGSAFAASEEARDTVFSSEQKIKSVDNSFIVNTDLDSFTPVAQITDVTEDNDNYYITYALNTIDLTDGRWGVASQTKELVVSKTLLGAEDLGVYVAEEIKEVTDRQSAYLKEVQIKERKNGETEKVLATTYSGLIGKYLDPKEEVIAGYEPVVKQDSSVISHQSSGGEQQSGETTQDTQAASVASTQVEQNVTPTIPGAVSASTGNATMVMIGNNPAKVPTSATGGGYSDNGVRATTNDGQNISVSIAVDGVLVNEVAIDTRTPGAHMVRYTADDRAGNMLALERSVIVHDRYKTKEPAIVILGDAIVSSVVGEPYTDAGAVAIDYDDGDISNKITVLNTVNVGVAGTYKVQYSVNDSHGNISVAARIVTVVEP